MSAFFLVLLGLAIFHAVYDGVILPAVRFRLRYKLFMLRDELRWLKGESSDAVSEEVFSYLQGAINNAIRILPIMNLEMIYRAKRAFEEDPVLREHVERRLRLVNDCSVQEVRRIHIGSIWILGGAFIANSFAWLIYFLPILLGMVCFQQLKYIIKRLMAMAEFKVDRIIPSSNLATI